MSFTHLHVHTTWSRFDGLARIEDLFQEASRMRQPGLAITDHGTMAGVPEFLTVAAKYPQVKPIVGCEFYLAEGSISKPFDRNFHLVLLAKNLTGYHTLLKLCSIAGTEGLYKGKPRIDHNTLSDHHEGLIALSACIGGEIPQAILEKDMEKARDLIRWYRNLFGDDFYLEVSQHNSRKRYYKGDVPKLQEKANKAIFHLGKDLGVKVVATNDVHMVDARDYKTHEVLLCCNTKTKMEPGNKYFYTGEEYLKSEEAMLDIFADHPEVISNTSEILEKIERFDIKSPIQLPDFPLPKGYDTPEAYLRYLAKEGLKSRTLKSSNPKWGQRGEQERLDYELQVVTEKGFANYVLILWDIVRAVRNEGHIVGPGRDSTPSSFLCYVLGITDVDPIEVSLAFEQFISPVSNSLPDVNIDFDIEGRQIAYVHLQKTFGKDHVSRMGFYGRRYFKRSIKQVSEVHGIIEPDNNDKFINEATRLIKTIISVDMHSSAVLLSRNPMTEYLPVRKKWNSDTRRYELVSEYDAYHAEEMGILKLDFYSHRDLEIIREASKEVSIPDTFDDPACGDIHDLAVSCSMNRPGLKDYGHGAIEYRLMWLKKHYPDRYEQALSCVDMNIGV